MSVIEAPLLGLHSLEDYRPLIGSESVDRIADKAKRLSRYRITHVSSTFYGGGVAEMLSPLSLLMNACGIPTEWHLIQGHPDFFSVTKEIHNALQGAEMQLTRKKRTIYEEVCFENALRMQVDSDLIIVHDPQPLPLLTYLEAKVPAIWCCHVDLSQPNPQVWNYLTQFVSRYDAVVFSLPEYRQPIDLPQHFIMPAINPFSLINKDLSEREIDEKLVEHGICNDLPLVVQISRYDRWKDPLGVIEACRLAREQHDCRLVLLGNTATDDPEGQEVYAEVNRLSDDRNGVLSVDDAVLVNALQRRADVVVQKSIREGFGLTVAEAMWKGTPVVGGNVGGIRHQIDDGENGFLVDNIEQAARRVIELIKSPRLRSRLGKAGKRTVVQRFLMTRLMEEWMDVIGHTLGEAPQLEDQSSAIPMPPVCNGAK
jgi:trehalose synthase